MSPIFYNAEIPFDAVGDNSRETARKLHISENPWRLLVGGVRVLRIYLATALGARSGRYAYSSSSGIYAKSLIRGFHERSQQFSSSRGSSLRDFCRYDEIDR